MTAVRISELRAHVGETVTVRGWVVTTRSSGKIAFLVLRDGTGYVQGVLSKKEVPEAAWALFGTLTQEATVAVTGVVREDPRAPGGCRAARSPASSCWARAWTSRSPPRSTGRTFLFEHRHLWLRSRRQVGDRAGAARGRAGDPRLLLPARLHAGRHADPHRRDRRGGGQPLRHRLLRPGQGLPGADRASSTSRRPRRRWARSTASAPPSAPRSRRPAAT